MACSARGTRLARYQLNVKDATTNATRDPDQIIEWFAGTNHTVITVCDVGETYFLPEARDE